MNTTMNKAVPGSDLFHVFWSFYPHKSNRKSVKGMSVRISKMFFNQIFILASVAKNWCSYVLVLFVLRVQKSSVRKRDNNSVGSAFLKSLSPRYIYIHLFPRLYDHVDPCLRHSAGLHDEINWIIAIVGLCSLSEGNYLGYMAVNEWNHWHKACHTPVR